MTPRTVPFRERLLILVTLAAIARMIVAALWPDSFAVGRCLGIWRGEPSRTLARWRQIDSAILSGLGSRPPNVVADFPGTPPDDANAWQRNEVIRLRAVYTMWPSRLWVADPATSLLWPKDLAAAAPPTDRRWLTDHRVSTAAHVRVVPPRFDVVIQTSPIQP